MIEVGKVTAKSGLHLRKKPEAHAEILATLPFETVVDIDSREGNWLLVNYQFKSGYLYKDYVEVLRIPPKDIDPPYDPPAVNSYTKTVVTLVIVIVLAILAFSYGSLGWRH